MLRNSLAVLAAAATTLACPLAFAQSAAATRDGTVSPVTVTGRRPPAEIETLSESCVRAMRDPSLRALIAAGATPRIYVRTRKPLATNFNAPPKSAPGSALPEVASLKEWYRYARRIAASSPSTPGLGASANLDNPVIGVNRTDLGLTGEGLAQDRARFEIEGPANPDFTLEQAIAQCHANDIPGLDASSYGWGFGADQEYAIGQRPGPAFGAGRLHIKMNDRTLPMGMALYEDGRYEEALDWLKKAEHKLPYGHGGNEAALLIGKIYLYGLKEKSDPAEAVRWLDRVAGDRFDPWTQMPIFDPQNADRYTALTEANMILAEVYRTGRGSVPKDIDKCIRHLKRAVSAGHVPAAKVLGDIYYQGVERPRDLKAAFEAYSQGARFAHGPAMLAVAQMYEAGEAPGGVALQKALAWRAEAARRNDPEGLYHLAVAYDRGTGVSADVERALGLYKTAAMNGHAGAQSAIGTFFYRGEGGVPRDHATARKWFTRAGLGGDVDGMFNLAAMLVRGEGGEVDRTKAWVWLKVAERGGHENATAALRALEAAMTPQERAAAAELLAPRQTS